MADPKSTVTPERLQWILENIKDIIYTAGADGNITYISPQVSALGVTPDQIVGASLLEHIHPGDLERVMLDFQETVRTGREFPTRFRVLTPDGRVVHLEEYGKVTMVDGKVAEVTGVIRDITERAVAEQARLESEERFRAIFDRSRDCVFVVDFEGRFLDANQAALTLLGYRADEVQQVTYQSILDEEGLERALTGLAELLKVGIQRTPNVHRVRRKDGATLDVEVVASIIYRGGVPYAVLGVARDITERRRTEDALQASEERLTIILDNSRDIIYAADARGRVTYVSPQIAALGLKPEEVTGTDMFALVHPDDRPSVMATFLESLERELNRMNYFRLVGRGGRVIFVEESSRVHREGGRATGITGILRDISERKRLELERDEIFGELTRSLAEVKQLSGIIPICAGCKKIRDEKGIWKQVEHYIREHSQAEFSHGLCPDCMTRLYPEHEKPE